MKNITKYITGSLLCISANYVVAQEQKPNIIFFIADDMTPDMFNCLPEGKGKNLTPNIDFLVKGGTFMAGQHVSSTVSSPSRFSCLTGKYASRANNPQFLRRTKGNDNQAVVEWNTHIMKGEQNIALLLKNLGYETATVGKNHVINVPDWKKIPLSADTADAKVKKTLLANYDKVQTAYHDFGFDYAEGLYYENPDFNGPMQLAVHNLDWTTEAACNFIGKTSDAPFFLYFATTLPHAPSSPERSWNADRHIIPTGLLETVPTVLPDKNTIPTRLHEAGIKGKGGKFNNKANLLWLDDALGALISKLKTTGQLENTIIFFFNDHGQNAKGTIYQEGTVTPSIIWKSGGFPVGDKCNTIVSNIDFAPTIVDMAGGKYSDKGFDGSSFKSALEGSTDAIHTSLYFDVGFSRGVLMGDYKYIALRYPEKIENITPEERKEILKAYNLKLKKRGKQPNNTDPNAPFGHVQIIPGGGDAEYKATLLYKHYTDRNQLYNLKTDPNEQNNLFDDKKYKEKREQLKSELLKYLENLPGNFGDLKTEN